MHSERVAHVGKHDVGVSLGSLDSRLVERIRVVLISKVWGFRNSPWACGDFGIAGRVLETVLSRPLWSAAEPTAVSGRRIPRHILLQSQLRRCSREIPGTFCTGLVRSWQAHGVNERTGEDPCGMNSPWDVLGFRSSSRNSSSYCLTFWSWARRSSVSLRKRAGKVAEIKFLKLRKGVLRWDLTLLFACSYTRLLG